MGCPVRPADNLCMGFGLLDIWSRLSLLGARTPAPAGHPVRLGLDPSRFLPATVSHSRSPSEGRGLRPSRARAVSVLRRGIAALRSERWLRMALAMAMLLVLYGSWQVLHWGPSTDHRLIADGFFYLVAGTAVLTAWSASQRCKQNPKLRRAWRLFAMGLLGQLSGQVAFMVYDLLGKTPYPSIADVLYLGFYPLMLVGLLSLPVAKGDVRRRVRLAVDLAVVAIGGSAAVVYVVLGPTLVANSGSPLQVGFSVAYPAGDLVLLVGLASLLLRGSAPSARWALRLLGAGL